MVANYTSALRVLIVDDEPLMRWAISETLAAAGEVPIVAADGREAILAASGAPPVDIILLDYGLPDYKDFGLLAILQSLAAGAAIILMCAYDSPDFRTSALRLGANRVLSKPLDMTNLHAIVNDANRCRPI